MGNFEFPTNIKQMGSISDGIRVYMEDYVYTYLKQFAKTSDYDERIAFLLGRSMVIDGQTVNFISGAVQGKHSVQEKGLTVFSEKSFEYLQEEMDKYFTDLEVIGWMQSQPSYGTFLNQGYSTYHLNHFPKSNNVMFIVDPIEELSAFYVYNNIMTDLVETKGYFIYYDKNRGMHEYMLNNKVIDFKIQNEDDYDSEDFETDEDDYTFNPDNFYEDSRRSENKIPNNVIRKSTLEQKRILNMLVSLSAVLFIICFIMGASLIQNGDRIAKMESDMNRLSTAYISLKDSITGDSAQTVFASQNQQTLEETVLANEVAKEQVNAEINQQISQQTNNTVTEEKTINSSVTTVDGNDLQNNKAPDTVEVEILPNIETTTTQEVADIPATIPKEETNKTSENNYEKYIVQEGDSLLSISIERYGTQKKVKDIMALNNLNDADKIYFGKILLLP